MSMQLDRRLAETGTRFRIFPQPKYLRAFSKPDLVVVSVAPGDMQPGPADGRMYVVDALEKRPYAGRALPPFAGPRSEPVEPSADGHFDHLKPGTREFSCATMYATVRRVLDIWEDYFGQEIEWHFLTDFARMELIPLIEWDNAQSGYGFLEFGFGRKAGGGIDYRRPYCENFDVLAHEMGHSLIFAVVGVPRHDDDEGIDYGGMHESAGDLVAIVASLHFNSVVDHLLEQTKGNLFSVNELDRVGELSESREIRVAFNYARMSDVGEEPHDRSLPLTGAIFDVFVEIFQKELVGRRLITQDLADRSFNPQGGSQGLGAIQQEFSKAYGKNKKGFKDALLSARDSLGFLLAATWKGLSPDYLTYHRILRRLLRADRALNGGRHQQTIRDCFSWRQISIPGDSLLLKSFRLADCLGVGEEVVPGIRPVTVARAVAASRAISASRKVRSTGRHGAAEVVTHPHGNGRHR